jgi:predicted phosphodiesterase
MNHKEIIEYIKSNPEVGRRNLSKMFGISQYTAEKIKKECVPEQYMKKSITEKDVAKFLKERGLSEKSVIELLTPNQYSPRIIGNESIKEFSIGIIGDTHLCDKACALDELHDFYHKCKESGVEHVVHAGDVTAGIRVYPGQEFDLIYHGFSEQLKHVIESYPQIDGITTHVIAGNHDLSFKQHAGASFVEEVSNKRNDIEWVGDYAANISINGISIRLHHGDGGVGYAASYRLQRNVEAFESGEKPQIYVLGHYHRTLAMFIRNVHSYMPGCWQRPTDFSIRKGLPNQICGYIAHVKTLNDNRNSIRSISSEIITYY